MEPSIKNKKGGVVTNTVMGVGGLVIGVIVVLIIVQTLTGANIIGNDSVTTTTVTNESVTITGTGIATISISTLKFFTSWNATTIINGSAITGLTNDTLVEGIDYQIFSANGSIGNITTWDAGKSRVTYTYTLTDTTSKNTANNLSTNLSSGINNIALKIPTILLIVAVVFLFGALVLLIRNSRLMGIGGGGSL